MLDTYMLAEIREQPDVLERVREQTRDFLDARGTDLKGIEAIHLLGCGDMDFSARTASWLARGGARPVFAHRSMDLRWKAASLTPKDRVIAASFSGRTPRTREAARLARAAGASVWGITGNEGSPLTETTCETLVLDIGPREDLTRHAYAGYHHNVPQTKSYVAVLLAELMLLDEAGCLDPASALELGELVPRIREALPALEEGVGLFMDASFETVDRVAVLGSGPYRATAAYGAAKFLEMALPARYQCLEENNHLEMFVTRAEDLMVFLAPDLQAWTRAAELLEPYGRFNTQRLAMATSSSTGVQAPFVADFKGAALLTLPEGGPLIQVFHSALALQLLAAAVGPALGRDIDQWVGGVRTEFIESLGHKLVRDSKIQGKINR